MIFLQKNNKTQIFKKSLKFIFVVGILLISLNANACRYTVGEIGFAGFSTDNYHLYFFNDNSVCDQMVSKFKKISFVSLLDANIKPEIVDVFLQQEHPAMEYYNSKKNQPVPQVVLASPDGRSLTFHLSSLENDFDESIWIMLKQIIQSPARQILLESIVEAYGIVLFVEGKNQQQNNSILRKINSAIKTISASQQSMPKPVSKKPMLQILKNNKIDEEKVLLWSLGYDTSKHSEPAIFIIYGKGRRMGKVLSGNLLEEIYISNLLTIIGADCECGLNRSWLTGTMMPLRWNKKRQQEVVKWRGFDAENPLVKSEMSQIISIPNSGKKQEASETGSLYGYTENEIEAVNSYNKIQQDTSPTPLLNFHLSDILTWIGGIILVILSIGFFIYFRKK